MKTNDGTLEIKRGTTPTIVIDKFPESVDLTSITEIWFSISQDGNTTDPLIKKETDSITIDPENNRIWLVLTQEETMSFKPTSDPRRMYGKQNEVTSLEVSILFNNGVRAITKTYLITILDCIREGIMTGADLDIDEPLTDSLILSVDIGNCMNIGLEDYNDLQNKPSINGVELVGDKTSEDLDINIPTKTSELENDSGYITEESIPTDVSAFNNDAGYITRITSSDVTDALGYTPYNESNPNDYQENVIESVSVNGTELVPENKSVAITVPTKVSDLQNDSGYVSVDDIKLTATYNDGVVTLLIADA